MSLQHARGRVSFRDELAIWKTNKLNYDISVYIYKVKRLPPPPPLPSCRSSCKGTSTSQS